ncbi:MAG: HAD-IA family hydrolase [Caldimonas sp.]
MLGSVSRRYALLSFDLDGTLADTAGEIAEAANRTLEEAGLPSQTLAAITLRIGAGTRELMLGLLDDIVAGTGRQALDREGVLRRFSVHYAAAVGTSCRPYPHAVAALERLRAAGLRLACVTNKEERYSVGVLAACGLGDFFDLLVGGDTLAVKKPDAGVLGHVIGALGATRAATAHVGDSRIDVESARNAGVAAWAVPYGYNRGEPIENAHPDRLFRDLGEVAACVLD